MTGGECSVNKTIIIVSVYLQYMYIDSIVCVVHLVKKGDARPQQFIDKGFHIVSCTKKVNILILANYTCAYREPQVSVLLYLLETNLLNTEQTEGMFIV